MSAIQRHMLQMFIALRWGVGIVGLSLPFVLAGWGHFVAKVPFAGSMSAYYHANQDCWDPQHPPAVKLGGVNPCLATGAGPMRNWFVGCLFFIGGAMLLMRGFSLWEDWALNIAGIMAPCVALFPMRWEEAQKGFSLHFTFAVTFFVCVGFTCVFCSGKTLKEMPREIRNRERVIAFFKHWYRILGTVMIVAPACSYIFLRGTSHFGFFIEASGVGAFGAYWLFKTWELKHSDVEGRVLRGELQMDTKRLR